MKNSPESRSHVSIAAVAALATAMAGAGCDVYETSEQTANLAETSAGTPQERLGRAFQQLNEGFGTINDLQRELREQLGMQPEFSAIDGCWFVAADTAHRAEVKVCVGCSSHAEGGRILMGTPDTSPTAVATKRAMGLVGGPADTDTPRTVVSAAGDEVVCVMAENRAGNMGHVPSDWGCDDTNRNCTDLPKGPTGRFGGPP